MILDARHIIIIPVDIIIMNFSRIVFRHLLMPELCIKSVYSLLKSAHPLLKSAHSLLKSVYCLRKLSELVCNLL